MPEKKILLVDDEPSIVKIVRKRLEQHHYEVTTAADGLEGLERALADRPDLIITDIMMPTMDGYTFLKKLRAKPQLASIPVIILTAKEKMEDLFLFEGIQTCDYIVKPFESEVLLEKIVQLLQRVENHLNKPPPAGA